MNRTFWLFILSLCVAGQADAGQFTLLAGTSHMGRADDGTYWNETNQHAIDLTKGSVGLRWDSERIAQQYSVGLQYTHFGTASIDAMAVTTDAPRPGGYDPATNSCVGPCKPLGRWVMQSKFQSWALIATRHWGNWSADLGANFYEVRTSGYALVGRAMEQYYEYPTETARGIEPMLGITYRLGNWSVRAQYFKQQGRGFTPSVSVGATTSFLLGYSF